MSAKELVAIVDGSFDAGFIVDETGIIVHKNRAAYELFSLTSSIDAGHHIDSNLSGWKAIGDIAIPKGDGDLHYGDIVLGIVALSVKGKSAPKEWRATGKRNSEDTTEFPARVKLTFLPKRKKSGHTYAIIFVRVAEPEVSEDRTEVLTKDKKLAPATCPFPKPDILKGYVVHNPAPGKETGRSSVSSHQQIESLMAAIVETSLDPMFQINEKGIISMANRAALKQFGWSREEFLGSNISMIAGDGHGKNHDSYIQTYLETGETKVIGKRRELKARRKDGSEFPIELAVTEIDTFEGEERLFCGFVRDITDIKRKQSLSAGIIGASLDPMLVINEKGIIQMSNVAATSQFGWSEDEFLGCDIRMLAGLDYHQFFFQKQNGGKKCELPVRRKNATVFPAQLGVVEIETHGEEGLLCETFHDLTSIRREESFRAGVIEAALDPMFQINERGIITMVNKAATQQFGWSREEFLGSNISMIAGGAHRKYHDDYIRRYLQTGEARVIGKKRELSARRKDGSEFRIELGVMEMNTDYGGEHLFCGYVHDVTRIKKNERLFTGIIEASLDPMFQINEIGTIQMVNNAAVRLFGWNHQEFLGKNISMIAGGGHGVKHDEYIRRYLKTGETRVIGKKRHLPARRKDGTEFPIELGVAEIKTDIREDRMFCGFVRDLSELKKVEKLSHDIFQSIRDPMFQVNEAGTIKMINEAAADLFERSQDECVGNSMDILLASGDLDVQEFIKKSETGRKLEIGASRKDKGSFPAEFGVVEIVTDQNEDFLYDVLVRDLSTQKEYEDELKQSEALVTTIVEVSPTAILVTDRNGIVQRANAAAVDMVGGTFEHLNHQNIDIIFHPEDVAVFLETFEQCLRVTEPMNALHECEATRANGSRFRVASTVRKLDGPHDSNLFAIFIEDNSDDHRIMKSEIERAVAEALLLNVLPNQFVDRLSNGDSRTIQRHDSVTVLFADIVEYGDVSRHMDPVVAVSILNDLHSVFDNLVEAYDLTKVKTIGSCYMVADVPGEEHEESGCCRTCHLSLDMLLALKEYNYHNPAYDFSLRIGIQIGAAFFGVVGSTNFVYDMWGDAVKVASQMENTCISGNIQVTKDVVDAAGDSLSFDSRRTIDDDRGDEETFLLLDRTHRFRQMRRHSFYKRISSLKSFGEGPSRLGSGNKSCRMDFHQALRALDLLPASSKDDDLSGSEDGFDFSAVRLSGGAGA